MLGTNKKKEVFHLFQAIASYQQRRIRRCSSGSAGFPNIPTSNSSACLSPERTIALLKDLGLPGPSGPSLKTTAPPVGPNRTAPQDTGRPVPWDTRWLQVSWSSSMGQSKVLSHRETAPIVSTETAEARPR